MSDEAIETGGLMGGIDAYHIRMLTENSWNGGGGYTLQEVGQMTLDQIWFRLCDMKYLKNEVGKRAEKIKPSIASGSLRVDDKGMAVGETADGKKFRAQMGGKSLARRLMEQKEKREAANRKRKDRKE